MPEIVVAPAARLDLIEVWDYFDAETGDPQLADRFVSAASATFDKLLRTPGLGRPSKLAGRPKTTLRLWRVDGFPNYLIFYRPFQNGIEIVRVIHGARDLGVVLGE